MESEMLCRLNHALHTDDINLKYQPVYSILTEKIVGFETLLRWRDPYFGHVCPETVVALATKNRLMHSVSAYVIKKAISEMREIIKAHTLFLSLNLNPADLISVSFKNLLITELAQQQLSPSSIMLEITEVPCNDLMALNKGAVTLAEKGFRLALDDFGKGCSDVERLRSLPVSEVKIDRAMTHHLFATDNTDARVMCDSLYQAPYPLIFEGVETQTQLAWLAKRFPRARVQGWYFSKAVSIDGVRALLGESTA
jgi:sensor c-di-GMP phosphodiesterase-like protein